LAWQMTASHMGKFIFPSILLCPTQLHTGPPMNASPSSRDAAEAIITVETRTAKLIKISTMN